MLVIDDDQDTQEVVRLWLEREGYAVQQAADGPAGVQMVEDLRPDLVVLDVMLPSVDGLSVCQELRQRHALPILILSGRDEPLDRILGLEIGADDYLTKPFHPKELVARVRALLRRVRMTPAAAEERGAGKLSLDPTSHRATISGHQLPLTVTEFELLRVLAAHPGRVFGREDLVERVWGGDYYGDARVVDTHIRNIRAKLRAVAPGYEPIESVRGVGYRFEG
ncbi:MAG: response regulator transcription factor [Armatimonadetes bacterium]|nr:response regulator transcription factor [Armatimonadota bacterium]